MVFSLATNFTTPSSSSAQDEILEKAKEQQNAPSLNLTPKASNDSTKK
jgi:hypothetical protein